MRVIIYHFVLFSFCTFLVSNQYFIIFALIFYDLLLFVPLFLSYDIILNHLFLVDQTDLWRGD